MPLDKLPWTNETIMPWGEHKGTKLDDVPADYLIDLGRKKWLPSAWSCAKRIENANAPICTSL